MTIAFKTAQHKVVQHMERYHTRDLNSYERAGLEAPVQRNLAKELTEVAVFREIDPEDQKHVNMLLAKWVVTHFQPLVIVEDAGFLTLLRSSSKQFAVSM
ncbi:hypothetical protein DVH05_026455 [Phytophthora capsici]|nr:hypothetical protein DVH05_027269 [Phytophthora capsici]KAG1707261.1 hypothetical protein DVH05_026455 [Phytophthora capsici]